MTGILEWIFPTPPMITEPASQEEIDKGLLSLFLPEKTLDYFRVTNYKKTEKDIHVVLEEKNEPPPLPSELRGKRIQSKGLWNITVNDFPIRGRKVSLLFRRRVWKVEGQKELLKKDIPLTAEGTQLAQEFARFLKAGSRREARSPSGDS